MAGPYPGALYKKQFEEATKLFDDGHLDKCSVMANKNLTDPTLPRFYVIKNSILLACALDDWDKADPWRLFAEQQYQASFVDATRAQDTNALAVLSELRRELDELWEFRMEDLTGLAKDERDMAGFEDDVDTEEEVADMVYYDEDLAGMDVEDSEAVAEAENKKDMGVTAEHIRLPIRSASEHTTAMAHGNPAIDTNLYVQTPKAWTDAKPQPMTLADLHEDQKFFLSLTQHLPEDVSSRYKNAISKWQDRLAKNLSKEADKLENGSGD